MKATRLFFDTKKVIGVLDDATRKGMSRVGSHLRRRARSSIKRRKNRDRPSQPGSPPFAHTSDPVATLKNILFAYEPHQRTLVVGMVRLNAKSGRSGLSRGTVPQLHEFGDTTVTREVRRIRGAVGRDKKGKFTRGNIVEIPIGTTLKYPARPVMGPALQKELPNIPKQWAPSIQGSAA